VLLALYVKARTMGSHLRGRLLGESGAVATEYALLLVLIALAIISAATALGIALAGKYTQACNSIGGSGC
jgi:Flp pilus assembly pilin Flp